MQLRVGIIFVAFLGATLAASGNHNSGNLVVLDMDTFNTLTTIRPTGGSYAFVSVGPNDPPVGRTRRRELD
uniref:Uncharacterized protein n=1 Tax=Plectus sambesii TaxID=2011161 RepID=A0A914XB20_9BILA